VSSVVILLLLACTPKPPLPIDISLFESGLEYGTEWAVVNDPYATFRLAADFAATAAGHGRRGDVEKIRGQAIVPQGDNAPSQVWYEFEKGYLPDSSVIRCPNLFRAQQVSASIRD
jgi:hypothetical protein